MNAPRKVALVLMTLGCIQGTGCVPGEGLTGAGGSATAKPTVPVSTVIQTPGCTQALLNSIRVLSPSIDQRQAARTISLELLFAPCPAQPAPVALPIRFDVDSDWMLTSGGQPGAGTSIPFTLAVDSQGQDAGNLTYVPGQDLFGHTGSQYFALAGDRTIQVSPATSRAVLTIDMSGIVLAGAGDVVQASFNAPLFIQIGTAQPMTTSISVLAR